MPFQLADEAGPCCMEEREMVREQNVLATQSSLSWLKGALAGFIATAPMTVFMLTTQRFLPKGQQ